MKIQDTVKIIGDGKAIMRANLSERKKQKNKIGKIISIHSSKTYFMIKIDKAESFWWHISDLEKIDLQREQMIELENC